MNSLEKYKVKDDKKSNTGGSLDKYRVDKSEDNPVEEEESNTLLDMLKVMPQSATLEWADDIIEKVNPEWANDYRSMVAEARKNSPTATLVAEILTPDPISLALPAATKAGKISKLIAKGADMFTNKPAQGVIKGIVRQGSKSGLEGAATSAVQQLGEKGEVDPWETAISGVIGGGLGAPAGLASNPAAMRATSTGVKEAANDFNKVPKGSRAEYGNYLMDDMDKQFNLFAGGKVELDPKTLKFVNGSMGKVKGIVDAPSKKELLGRVKLLKKQSALKVKDILKSKSNAAQGSFDFMDEAVQVKFNRSDIDDLITRVVEPMSFKTPAARERSARELKYRVKQFMDNNDIDDLDLVDMSELKTHLDESITYADKLRYPDSDKLYYGIRSAISDKIEAAVENIQDEGTKSSVRSLNQLYGDLAVLENSLAKKLDMGDTTRLKAGSVSANPQYSIFSTIDSMADPLRDPVANMSAFAQRHPIAFDGGIARKSIPTLMTDRKGEEMMSREPQGSSDPLPLLLQNTRIPRTVEGIKSNQKILLARLAQERPDLFDQAQYIFKNRPEDLNDFIPFLIESLPTVFEKDRYNRINNIVPANMVPMVKEEIRKSSRSSTKRIKDLDLLYRTGEYYDNWRVS